VAAVSARRAPTFILAGVSKAGTTALHRYLSAHPQVFMSPIKEPTFFGAADLMAGASREAVLRSLARDRAGLDAYLAGPQPPLGFRFVLEWDDYLRLFRDAGGATAVGESSTAYFYLPGVPAAIRARLPDARVVFVLRDPAERLLTLYRLALLRDPRPTFRAWFEALGEGHHRWPSVVGAGRYATHLGRYFDAFPRDRLRVYLYDEYRADPQALLRDLFGFLGVRPDQPIDVSRRHNETIVPRFPRLHALRRWAFGDASPTRWLPHAARRALWRVYHARAPQRPMAPADRRMVIDYYRDEIVRTGDLLGRDLSAWLR
jgi:hypothetical protein